MNNLLILNTFANKCDIRKAQKPILIYPDQSRDDLDLSNHEETTLKLLLTIGKEGHFIKVLSELTNGPDLIFGEPASVISNVPLFISLSQVEAFYLFEEPED